MKWRSGLRIWMFLFEMKRALDFRHSDGRSWCIGNGIRKIELLGL